MKPVVGIIGAGHLGRALARVFLDHDIPPDRILISHSGKPETRSAIHDAGLSGCLSDNAMICARAEIIFIAVRPQAAATLAGLPFPKGRPVISCMAGIPTENLARLFSVPVIRMMPSGPETFPVKKGIAAVYPDNPFLERFLSGMDIRIYTLPDEQAMHVFTAAVCLPAAILAAGDTDISSDRARLFRTYPMTSEVFPWAGSVLPAFSSQAEKEAYITRMSTPGGVTEAIVSSIRSGTPFFAAFKRGIARCEELSRETAGRL